ncbi:hypothetical protein H6P81_018946 [Aristolochia fimbriata]|uniref:Uncharacterized protein n=1 Tax=Aristolochia fimbriata TaxID=158543 RepID=A0AAV7E2P9_ARIFI|nr:hypothetical protein H6P81_018946 [Aristolochia fimbriata]
MAAWIHGAINEEYISLVLPSHSLAAVNMITGVHVATEPPLVQHLQLRVVDLAELGPPPLRLDRHEPHPGRTVLGRRVHVAPPVHHVSRHPPAELLLELRPGLVLVVVHHPLRLRHLLRPVPRLQLEVVHQVEEGLLHRLQKHDRLVALLHPTTASVPLSHPLRRVRPPVRRPELVARDRHLTHEQPSSSTTRIDQPTTSFFFFIQIISTISTPRTGVLVGDGAVGEARFLGLLPRPQRPPHPVPFSGQTAEHTRHVVLAPVVVQEEPVNPHGGVVRHPLAQELRRVTDHGTRAQQRLRGGTVSRRRTGVIGGGGNHAGWSVRVGYFEGDFDIDCGGGVVKNIRRRKRVGAAEDFLGGGGDGGDGAVGEDATEGRLGDVSPLAAVDALGEQDDVLLRRQRLVSQEAPPGHLRKRTPGVDERLRPIGALVRDYGREEGPEAADAGGHPALERRVRGGRGCGEAEDRLRPRRGDRPVLEMAGEPLSRGRGRRRRRGVVMERGVEEDDDLPIGEEDGERRGGGAGRPRRIGKERGRWSPEIAACGGMCGKGRGRRSRR